MAELVSFARSWKLGLPLATAAIAVVVIRLESEDFELLGSVSPIAIAGSGLSYAFGLLALAVAPTTVGGFDRRTLGSGMAAHLLKYVPGSVWQGQRLFAVGGAGAVGRFVLVVVLAAGAALLASGHLWSTLVGATVTVMAVWLGNRAWGGRAVIWFLSIGVSAALAIGVSGGILGAAMGIGFVESARDIGAAWGLGVVAVPVPAGLGVRELYLSVGSDSALSIGLGLAHRMVSLGADAIVGWVGLTAFSVRRSTEP